MDFLSVGQDAEGFIAIGQHARGVIAFGQIATGVIAVGQVARGCFTIGQVALGFVGWGQVGFGLLHAVGMVGAGGRGWGLVLRLTPGVGRSRVPPEVISLERARAGESGWISVDLFTDERGLGLATHGERLPVKLDRRLQRDAGALTVHGARPVWAYAALRSGVPVCERILHAPPRPYEKPGFYARASLQFAALVALAVAWWMFAGGEVITILNRYFEL
jgi:hypothetical protein